MARARSPFGPGMAGVAGDDAGNRYRLRWPVGRLPLLPRRRNLRCRSLGTGEPAAVSGHPSSTARSPLGLDQPRDLPNGLGAVAAALVPLVDEQLPEEPRTDDLRWLMTAPASSINANHRSLSRSHRTRSRRQQLNHDSDRSTRQRWRPSRVDDSVELIEYPSAQPIRPGLGLRRRCRIPGGSTMMAAKPKVRATAVTQPR
jgi:hypothetical protein